jgi:hypothetical protein
VVSVYINMEFFHKFFFFNKNSELFNILLFIFFLESEKSESSTSIVPRYSHYSKKDVKKILDDVKIIYSFAYYLFFKAVYYIEKLYFLLLFIIKKFY